MKACLLISLSPFILPAAHLRMFSASASRLVSSRNKPTLGVSCLPPPRLWSVWSFVRTMAGADALGDLLLDPTSVRCRDERKAMKGGWEVGRSRWKIDQYTGEDDGRGGVEE